MEKKTYWRGVEGVEMLWHGEWADPELRYDNIVANLPSVEDELAFIVEGLNEWDDVWDGTHEEEFSQWCRENPYEVIQQIYNMQSYESKRYCFFDRLDGDSVVFDKPILTKCWMGQVLVSELFFDEEYNLIARLTHDLHGAPHALYTDVVIPYSHKWKGREVFVVYGDEEFENALIEAYAEQCNRHWFEEHPVYY